MKNVWTIVAGVLLGVALILPGCASRESETNVPEAGSAMNPSVTGYWEPQPTVLPSTVTGPTGMPMRKTDGFSAPDARGAAWGDATGVDGVAAAPAVRFDPTDEILVIALDGDPNDSVRDDAFPGSGALVVPRIGHAVDVPVPLAHTDVNARIDGFVSEVTVSQRFENPFDEKIEAVYVFPLPQNAAVRDFVMTIGERRIRGILRERSEAEQIYSSARAQGYTASLMTQERPNVFTQRVANIEPGRSITVDVTYFGTLRYENGEHEFTFPMVVGPRYNPPESTPGGIGVTPRGEPGGSGHTTEVQYLRPEERSGHDISVAIALNAGVSIRDVRSTSHVVDVEQNDASHAQITLSPRDSVPNRDFVLRWRVAGAQPKSALFAHRSGDDGGHFALMIYPPVPGAVEQDRVPVETTFVIDTSGSMKGRPLEQARAATIRALQRLEGDDAFRIVRFSNTPEVYRAGSVRATRENVRDAVHWVERIESGGGTEMRAGMRAALEHGSRETGRVRHVTFMTDGYIGNEREVLRALHADLGEARVFSFGVGSAPNRYLMHRMAKAGRGAATTLPLDADARAVMDLFLEQVRRPMLTDVEIDWSHAVVRDVTPAVLPDLMSGRPLLVTGRYEEPAARATVVLRGRRGSRRFDLPVDLDFASAEGTRAITAIWARRRIAEWHDQMSWSDDPELDDRIRDLALEHGLLSAYTSFVAVDSSQTTEGDHGTTVAVPVPVPAGARYDTNVDG